MSFDVITGASKEDVVAQLSEHCIEHELVGNILWAVQDIGDGDNIIVCFSLASTEHGWGYKEIPECFEPVYYNCPPRFLKLAPMASMAWRLRVLAFHSLPREAIR